MIAPAYVTNYIASGETRSYTRAVLQVMAAMVARDLSNPDLRKIAASLVVPGDEMATLERDFAYLKRVIPFVPDPEDRELIRSARFTLLHGTGGDCDDMSVAAAVILILQGFRVSFRAIAWRSPDFTHVYDVVHTSAGAVDFDLTLEKLNDARIFRKNIDLILPMPHIQAIADYYGADLADPTTQTVQHLANLLVNGKETTDRVAAYRTLERMYPAQLRYLVHSFARDASIIRRNPSLGDCTLGDWLSSALGAVGAIVGTVALPGVGTAAGASVGKLLGSEVSSVVGTSTGGDTGSGTKYPGYSNTDARVYMNELPQIYKPSGPTQPTKVNDGTNYSVVLHVPVLPKLDQHIDTDHPGHIFLSWDPVAPMWISDLSTIQATTTPAGWTLTGTKESGDTITMPGYYFRTMYDDGTDRFDFIGMTGTSAASSKTAQKNGNAETASGGSQVTQGGATAGPGGGAAGGAAGGATTGGAAGGTGTATAGFPSIDLGGLSGALPWIVGGAVALMALSK